MTKGEDWSLEFFKSRCNTSVSLKKKNPLLKSWGRLEDAGELPLSEFIDSFRDNETMRSWYLHDWSLPRSCPEAFGPPPYREFQVPKYFAGDYFQRAPMQGYQH